MNFYTAMVLITLIGMIGIGFAGWLALRQPKAPTEKEEDING